MKKEKWLAILAVISTSMLLISRRSVGRTFLRRHFSKATEMPKLSKSIVVDGKNDIEKSLPADIEEIHTNAVLQGKDTYEDPATGFTVFTRLAHLKKEQCCGCRCRHCPYGHVNVGKKVSQVSKPKALSGKPGGNVAHSNVYTKGGDKGSSSLYNGERRRKSDPVFEALGTVDELSSQLGLARALLREVDGKTRNEKLMDFIESIQQELLNVGTVIATPTPYSPDVKEIISRYQLAERTQEMEKYIDEMDSTLAPQRLFILPGGGNSQSAQLHVCRTTCRRAERRMIEVRDQYEEQYDDYLRQATVYVNRMSDFLFVAARSVAEEDIVRTYK